MTRYSYKALARSLKRKGIENERVLEAIANTPRHMFMPEDMRPYAQDDMALPIGKNQTISQPYVVARMTETLLEHGPLDKVLEIGTGSGYQAAILSQLANDVYTIERIESLFENADAIFDELNYTNIHTRYGDGHLGWEEEAPFNGIIVTAATSEPPPALLEQLADHSNLIIPLGNSFSQILQLITRQGDQFYTRALDPVMFVPLKPGIS